MQINYKRKMHQKNSKLHQTMKYKQKILTSHDIQNQVMNGNFVLRHN